MGCAGSKEKNANCTEVAHVNLRADTEIDKHLKERSNVSSRRNPPTSRNDYWHSIRNDVMSILQDLNKKVENGSKLSPGESEYADMLKRWLQRHTDTDPGPGKPRQPPNDANNLPFPVPEDVDSLREWIQVWEPFDTNLGEGQTAWNLLSEDVIRNGLTTPYQQGVLAAREKRRLLHEPEHMRKRREELAKYFVKKYRLKKGKVSPYLRWADLMVKNQADLEGLINSSSHSD